MIVLDTDVMIDLLLKREPTTSFLTELRRRGETLGTTSLNAAELLRGAHEREETRAKALTMLRALADVPFGPRAARRYGQLMHGLDRAGTPIGAVDGFVAAASLEVGGRLVTRNAREFERVAGLTVLVPSM